ncbi:hypothetical protein ACJX0J_033266, partial [Zea mays]
NLHQETFMRGWTASICIKPVEREQAYDCRTGSYCENCFLILMTLIFGIDIFDYYKPNFCFLLSFMILFALRIQILYSLFQNNISSLPHQIRRYNICFLYVSFKNILVIIN